jgi:peptide deformylase
MAKLSVLTYPTPSLRKPSRDVQDFDSRLGDLVRDMFETMYADNGIGLAAPQIGENINLLVMDVGRPDPQDPQKEVSHQICLVNPKIVQTEGVIVYEEGCLSCPELLVEVERVRNIVVEAKDSEGRPLRLALSELEAVCTQHEMDHLQGILLTDRISRLQREIYGKKRIRVRKEESDKGDLE